MELMERVIWQNTVSEWLVAIAVLVGGIIALAIVKKVLVLRVRSIAEKTKTDVDDVIVDVLGNTKFFFMFLVSLKVASNFVTLQPDIHAFLRVLFALAFLFQVGIWGNTLIVFWFRRTMKERMEEDVKGTTSLSVIKFIGRLVLWSVLLLVMLDTAGINVTAFVTTLGIGGIAVALALQNVLGDLFASLSIILDKPFVVGDFVVLEDYMGKIEQIGIKSTKIRSLGGEQIVISNSELTKSRIRNFKRMQERRILFTLGVTYQTPAAKLEKIPSVIQEVIENTPMTRFDRAHFMTYGNFSLNFDVVYYVLSGEYLDYANTQQAINMEIYRRFQKMGIDFAYPTQTLFIEK